MCDPISLMAVGSAVLTAAQQQQAVDAQNEYQQLIYDQNLKLANEAAIEEFGALHERELQTRARLGHDIRAIASQARQARAAATLSAVESGASGKSVDLLLASFSRQEAGYQEIALQNQAFLESQLRAERQAVSARRQGRAVSALPFLQLGPFDSPLGIASVGLNAAAAGFGGGY